MKRKKQTPIRDRQIHFRVTQELYDVICTDAKNAGLSVSVFCRNAVLNRKIQQRSFVIHDDTELVHELRNLNKLGSNLNQIARYFHEGGSMTNPLAQELHHAISEIDKMVIRCNLALEKEYGE